MFQILWNHRTCGRCGGTGTYRVAIMTEATGGSSGRVCYGCQGAGIIISEVTRRNRAAFQAWAAKERATVAQELAALRAGTFGRAFKLIFPTES